MFDAEVSERADAVLSAARAKGLTLGAAESCTGGLVLAALTARPGSSDVVDRGFITYSNAAKEELLGVAHATLIAHGAVSEPTAREMAAGALARSNADVCVSVTGIAGPGGGSPDKPVGTVVFGLAARGLEPNARTHLFSGLDRDGVRRISVLTAFDRLIAGVEAL